MTNPYPAHSPEWLQYEIFSGGTNQENWLGHALIGKAASARRGVGEAP